MSKDYFDDDLMKPESLEEKIDDMCMKLDELSEKIDDLCERNTTSYSVYSTEDVMDRIDSLERQLQSELNRIYHLARNI